MLVWLTIGLCLITIFTSVKLFVTIKLIATSQANYESYDAANSNEH